MRRRQSSIADRRLRHPAYRPDTAPRAYQLSETPARRYRAVCYLPIAAHPPFQPPPTNEPSLPRRHDSEPLVQRRAAGAEMQTHGQHNSDSREAHGQTRPEANRAVAGREGEQPAAGKANTPIADDREQ